jgi:hypothetical protein
MVGRERGNRVNEDGWRKRSDGMEGLSNQI